MIKIYTVPFTLKIAKDRHSISFGISYSQCKCQQGNNSKKNIVEKHNKNLSLSCTNPVRIIRLPSPEESMLLYMYNDKKKKSIVIISRLLILRTSLSSIVRTGIRYSEESEKTLPQHCVWYYYNI